MPSIHRRSILVSAALGALGVPSAALANPGYPERPIRVVVPFAAGNVLDIALRQVAEEFKKTVGQPIVVDVKPGGAGLIAAQSVASAPPDGYTLLLSTISMLTINPFTFSKLPYDSDKSFRHVTGFYGTPMVMAVNANVPANNLKEFIDWAKKQTTPVSFASFSPGNSSHFMGVILNQRAGIDMVHVPYNGTPPAVQALLANQVSATFLPMTAVKAHVAAGKLKILAVSNEQRSSHAPGVATFKEQGFPDLMVYVWSGISAPAGTPDAIVAKLNAEFTKILRSPEIRAKWAETDAESMPMSSTEFTTYMHGDAKRWAEAVRLSGFKANQ